MNNNYKVLIILLILFISQSAISQPNSLIILLVDEENDVLQYVNNRLNGTVSHEKADIKEIDLDIDVNESRFSISFKLNIVENDSSKYQFYFAIGYHDPISNISARSYYNDYFEDLIVSEYVRINNQSAISESASTISKTFLDTHIILSYNFTNQDMYIMLEENQDKPEFYFEGSLSYIPTGSRNLLLYVDNFNYGDIYSYSTTEEEPFSFYSSPFLLLIMGLFVFSFFTIVFSMFNRLKKTLK